MTKRRYRETSKSRRTDPITSQDVGDLHLDLNLRDEIEAWLAAPRQHICTHPGRTGTCEWAADFEITKVMEPFFPQVYEGQIRRTIRSLRDRDKKLPVWLRRIQTDDRHQHFNTKTGKWQQCHRMR